MNMWLYTTIIHPVRIHFQLTERDYCIIDTIAQLSANPNASVAGYCNASNGTIAKWLGTTPKNIIAVVKKAIDKGLIEVKQNSVGQTQLRRATQIWFDAVKNKKLPVTKGNTLTPKVTEPITNGNTPYNQSLQIPITNGNTDIYIDNNIDNNIDSNKAKNEFLPKKTSIPKSPSIKKQKEEQKEKNSAKKEKEELTEQDKQLLIDADAASKYPSRDDILRTQKPFGLNEGIFYELRVFAVSRQSRAKSKRMSQAAWDRMIRECQKAASSYSPQQLVELIKMATAKCYQSPFFTNYQKYINEQANNNNNDSSNTATTASKIDAAVREIYTKRFAKNG